MLGPQHARLDLERLAADLCGLGMGALQTETARDRESQLQGLGVFGPEDTPLLLMLLAVDLPMVNIPIRGRPTSRDQRSGWKLSEV